MGKKYKIKKAQLGDSTNLNSLVNHYPVNGLLNNSNLKLLKENIDFSINPNPTKTQNVLTRSINNNSNNPLNIVGAGGVDDLMLFGKELANVVDGNSFNGSFRENLADGFKLFNPAARVLTNIGNKLQEIKNSKNEQNQYLKSLQPIGYESFNEQGLNDNPIYLQVGGKISTVNGVSKYNNPIVEAEEGEVFTTQDGQIKKVAEGAGTHEEGGVLLNDVERVLEDTSDKRKDKVSQALKVSPIMAKLLADVDTKVDLSHSKVMEKAKEKQSKQLDKVQKNLQKNVDSLKAVPNNVYAQNSMDMNLLNLNTLPSEQEIFDNLFEHQEMIKASLGIQIPQAKCGGKYKMKKAQVGVDRRVDGSLLGTETPEGMGTNRKPKGNVNFMPVYNPADGKWYLKPRNQSDEPTGWLAKEKTLATANTYPNAKARFVNNDLVNQFPIQGVTDIDVNQLDLPIPKNPSIGINNVLKTSNNASVANSIQTKTGQGNRFNEPLNWFDVAGPLEGLLEGRIPVRYNGAQLSKVRFKKQNPLPALQRAQSDFNAILNMVSPNANNIGNLAQIFAKKYGLDNQVIGQYQDINENIANEEIRYNANVDDRQAALDMQARELFERKVLGSKEAQRKQRRTDKNSLYQALALNKKLNREGNLLMELFPALDQYGQYNGYRYQFRPPITTPKTKN